MSEHVRFPTLYLYPGRDDDLIEWLQGTEDLDANKSQIIRDTLRHGLRQTNGTTTAASDQTGKTEKQEPVLERGEAWAVELLQYRHGEMPAATVEALAASRNFRDVVVALDAIERFFESRNSWNEIILSMLWLACHQLLHRIHRRRQELAPKDRRRMQELAEQDLPFMSPPDLAKELTDRAEILYDQELSFEERQRLIATIRALFEEETDAQRKSFTH